MRVTDHHGRGAAAASSAWPAMPTAPARGGTPPLPEHMPASHRAHREWTPAKLIAWGERIGAATAARGALADGAPPASRAGLPRLPGPASAWPASTATSATGGRLRPGAGDPLADLPQRHLDPGRRPGSTAIACRTPAELQALPLHDNVRGPDVLPLTQGDPPCSTNTPWTNYAACAWTAWSHALQDHGHQPRAAALPLRGTPGTARAARARLARRQAPDAAAQGRQAQGLAAPASRTSTGAPRAAWTAP